jgi:hypothetical protein
MNNAEVITKLNEMLTELERRREELEAQFGRLSALPASEFADARTRLNSRAATLTRRIADIRIRRDDRQTRADLARAVKPLDAARVQAMRDALDKVQEAIVATAAISDVIRLAGEIGRAAGKAHTAASPESA